MKVGGGKNFGGHEKKKGGGSETENQNSHALNNFYKNNVGKVIEVLSQLGISYETDPHTFFDTGPKRAWDIEPQPK